MRPPAAHNNGRGLSFWAEYGVVEGNPPLTERPDVAVEVCLQRCVVGLLVGL